jgi:hypothetical protein
MLAPRALPIRSARLPRCGATVSPAQRPARTCYAACQQVVQRPAPHLLSWIVFSHNLLKNPYVMLRPVAEKNIHLLEQVRAVILPPRLTRRTAGPTPVGILFLPVSRSPRCI